MGLIAELQRRKVLKVGAGYLVAAWLMVQAASIGFPAFDAPPWALRVFILLALLGFPLAVAMAWLLDLTPEGIKLDSSRTGSKRLLAITAVLTGLAIAWYQFGQPGFRSGDPPAAAAPATVVPATVAPGPAAPAAGSKSIAVLPFADLSPEHDQEYFSDGMSEEILNALAQVKDLKVAGRTSSFHFKGRNEDLREIARTLGVAHILEGSVRKQGNKVRITAQLIQASDGIHLWSHAYDGELTDVFQLQENIARAITDQLKVVLEGGQKTRLVAVATNNPEAYSLYLRATAIFDRRDSPRYPDAITDLERAIALDPKYARAHSRLAALHVVTGSYSDVNLADAHAGVLRHARAALAIDPKLAEPHAAMALSFGKLPNGFLKQREEFDRALKLDPDDVTSNFWSGLSLVMTGYTKQGIAQLDHTLSVDPMMPNVVRWRGIMYRYAGDLERAEDHLKRARAAGLPLSDRELSEISFARGDTAAAIRQWPDGSRNLLRAMPPGSAEILAAGMYGDTAARARALALLDQYLATKPRQVSGQIPLVLAKMGEPRRALELLMSTPSGDNSDFFALMWSPLGKPLREQPIFAAFLRKAGFIELWEKYGPPDGCRRVAARQYACD